MTTPSNPSNLFSPFLPTTYNFPADEDISNFIQSNFAQHSDVINDKRIGIFLDYSATFNGETWYYKKTAITRNGYSVIAYISSFPNATTVSIPNPISKVNPELIMTNIYGTASKPCSAVNANDGVYFTFMSQGDSRISFVATDTLITITTTVDLSSYSGFFILEFVRNGV